MQLVEIKTKINIKKNKAKSSSESKLTKKIACATALLLGTDSGVSIADETWEIDMAGLIYSENNSRVTAIEPVLNIKKDSGDDRIWNLKLTLDSLTGATPTGALPSNSVQTFTRPSGEGEYTVLPNELPLDDTFKDTRASLAMTWQRPLSDTRIGTLGTSLSREYDFTSVAANTSLNQDFNQRNTTLSFGVGLEADIIEPEGGVPIAFAAMQPVGKIQPRIEKARETKTVVDALVGVTQVVNRRTLMQFNYSFGQSKGYLSDPFKLISVVEDITGALVSDEAYRFERRPDSRTKQAVFWRMKYRFDRDMFDLSYRYLWDTWEVSSHTIDVRYRWNLSPRIFFEPHLRFYQQTSAKFYRPLLLESLLESTLSESTITGSNFPDYASADLRLAKFSATTLGLKFSHRLSHESAWHIRFEVYEQSGESTPDGVFGDAAQQDLFPGLRASIFQAGYSLKW